MNLKNLVSNPRTMQLGMVASQHVPQALGLRLIWLLSGLVARLKPSVYQTALANLSQVLGSNVEERTLEETVRRVFQSALRSYYDLFRSLRLPLEKVAAAVDIPEATKAIARSLWNREGGSVLVFPHLGNFDLAGHAIAPYLPEMQLLTLPDPPPGFQLANELRRLTGVHVTPLSSTALRQALKLLRRGGTVALAGDRPVSELDEPVPFFGQPARVPSGHVRLALKTGAVVTVGYCVLLPETQSYTMRLEPPLEMIHTGDREEEVNLNMRRILDTLEQVIRRWPEQWQMFVPVWPKLLEA